MSVFVYDAVDLCDVQQKKNIEMHEQWTKNDIELAIVESFAAFLHGVLVSYGAFVCVLLHFVAFPLQLCLPTFVCN